MFWVRPMKNSSCSADTNTTIRIYQQDYTFTDVPRIAAGINWLPILQIAVKAEFSERFRDSRYNNEPSVSVGIAYMGFFK